MGNKDLCKCGSPAVHFEGENKFCNVCWEKRLQSANEINTERLKENAPELTDGELRTFGATEKSIKKVKEKRKRAETLGKAIRVFSDKLNLAEQFIKVQPLFYDKGKSWWIWDETRKCWEFCDETDLMNLISKHSEANTIKSSERTEIVEALRQVGRLNTPKDIGKTWVQFNGRIFDFKNKISYEATPEYFVTNPIPYDVNGDIETPNMDRIFEEWVGKDYVKTLYEILAYSILPDYPIHRLFCFIGQGMNGKSCYQRLLQKFVGDKNICSTELDRLMSSRFEVTKLHKKLVCVMGETNFSEMSKTAIIKQLTGQDAIGFEYKNKTPFDDINYAKIMIATNSLPATTDKTIGFYRRWMIIDFPNSFSEKKNILGDIPEEEYNNLATKCLGILDGLLTTRQFHNEGTIEERMKRYEEKSNPFDKFWSDNVDEDLEGDISKKQFAEKFRDWCKENRFRAMSDAVISRQMKLKGVMTGQKVMTWVDVGVGNSKPRYRCWEGIRWKE